LKNPNYNYEMSILVGHKPIPEYTHEGMTFVEGRDGSEYKIRIRNNSYQRACFVVSVDGLSVLDGKDAGDNSPGYIVDGHGSLDIACYKVDDKTGAKFIFGTKDHSYAADIGKGTDNTGVIAVKVFSEKYHPRYGIVAACAGMPPRRATKSSNKVYGSSGGEYLRSTRGWGLPQNSAGVGDLRNQTLSADVRGLVPGADDEAGLGTVFGDAMKWETTQVSFERNPIVAAQMVIYYDSKKGLERRGVKLEHKVPPLPNPFPADQGCAPPPGWRK
jgi:hypothetical protein